MPDPIHVLIDTAPIQNANAVRGVGVYTRLLVKNLEQKKTVRIFTDQKEAQLEKIDITHYPYFDFFFDTLPFKKKTKTVVTIHDVIPLVFKKQYWPGVKGWLRLQRQRAALKSVDAVITDSHASQKDIIEYLKLPEKKVHVVYLAANPNLYASTQEAIARASKKYGLPAEYVLYVGDINYNKNVPQLIKSLRHLPETLHLICVGRNFVSQKIPEWKAIETQLALSDVQQRVHFITDLGSEASEDLSALYSGAVAYIQPSLYEGFGLPVLEAMVCKTPVVAARNSSLIEVGGERVVYAETNAESLAESIKEVLEWSAAKRAQWVNDGAKWAQTFSWSKTADQTIAVYQSLL